MRVMTHRQVLDFLSDHKYVSIGTGLVLIIAVLAVLAPNFTQGSVFGNDRPAFDECSTNREGDITGCNVFGEQLLGFSGDFSVDSPNLSVEISDVQAADDEKHPATVWLYRNGYSIEQDRLEDINWNYGDVNRSSVLVNSLESASTCTVSFDIGSSGEVYIQTTEEDQQYNDEPWGDRAERHSRYIMQETVSLPASDIQISDSGLSCDVNLSEFMNQGMELNGEFQSWSGRGPVIEEVGANGDIQVDFEVNSDSDSLIDGVDACPYQAGTPEKNGCPNTAPVVNSVSGPGNVTVGEAVNYSVEVDDPDGDGVEVSWSNGETGRVASYSWSKPGEKSVTVSVDDGFEESSSTVDVRVKEKSFFGSILDFFGGIWNALWYSG